MNIRGKVHEFIKTNYNKDDNIHKSEALKWEDKRTITIVRCQN